MSFPQLLAKIESFSAAKMSKSLLNEFSTAFWRKSSFFCCHFSVKKISTSIFFACKSLWIIFWAHFFHTIFFTGFPQIPTGWKSFPQSIFLVWKSATNADIPNGLFPIYLWITFGKREIIPIFLVPVDFFFPPCDFPFT